jgi:hypothetical protein
MARFLVNTISDDTLTAETDQMETIMHNLLIIGQEYKDGFIKMVEETNLPFIVQICVCGRFITYIETEKDFSKGVMRFYDCKNDNDLALDNAKIVGDNWFGSYFFRWFMELFEQLKPHYSDNYNAAELILVENAGVVLN